jgi:hypothetical protein
VGFDSSRPGTYTVQFFKHGMKARFANITIDWIDTKTHTATIHVVDQTPPQIFFDYGRRISVEDPVPGRYTMTAGRRLVIAPVLWRIPSGASFHWSVSGGANTTAKGEFLTFNEQTPAGTYIATVTASGGGTSVSATTTVECVNADSPPSQSTVGGLPGGREAPGQFVTGSPTYNGSSLGGYGSYQIFDFSMNNSAGYDFAMGGNAFAAWQEPGIMWVMRDENKNNAPDDTWYELKGSIDTYQPEALYRRYAVTFYKNHAWEDNLGNHGSCDSFYNPAWPDQITFVGTRIDLDPNIAISLKGYVDTMYGYYDIDTAIQADGTPANLDHIDFVKVQTGEFSLTQLFGEKSTEIGGNPSGVWNKFIPGKSVAGGRYEYCFVNHSGYDLTITIRLNGVESEDYTVAAGESLTITRSQDTTYYNYVGGNVTCDVSGNTLTIEKAGGEYE